MNTFLDWLLNTDNQQRFETTGTTAGTLVKDLRDEIAAYINENSEDRGKDGWKPWTGYHVKYNKTACEAKYRRARDLMNKIRCDDDETTTLEEQVRKICPMFTRFHDVYLRSVIVNPPPMIMVQTTTIPGEPEPVLDNTDESNSDEGDESDENDEGDEDDEGHGHVQLEGFDLEKLFGTSDDDVDTRTTNSTTAPARLSQQQKKQDKKNASKDRGKVVEAYLRIDEKLDAIMQERGGIMGFLVGLSQDLSERDRAVRRREQEWLQNVYERQSALDWALVQRREEHDRELAAEKEWWREQMQKDMDMIQEQKEKLFQERYQFLQQQAGRKPIPTIQQTFNINTTRAS